MRGMPRRFSLAFTAVLTVLMMTACTDRTAAPSDAAPTPAANATAAPLLPTDVNALPATDLQGFQELMAQLKGTPVVVNLWASWCDPCSREVPKLVAAAASHEDVQFLGVDAQDSRSGAESFIADKGITYPSVFDPAGAVLTDQGALGLPVTIFVRADGSVASTVKGELSQSSLDEGLAQIAT
jgi:cytochrome c biogenesis protein CcmG, thiol:disulfide interchange protein DsbE